MQIENVSLIEVVAAARGRHASLVPESTGYLMLGVIRAMGGRHVEVDARRVMLSTEGVVSLTGQHRRVAPEVASRALHRLLRTLLDVSQGLGTALRELAEKPAPTLESLLVAVTKSLIPINRGAAKRSLGRLARETVRARERGLITTDDLDAEAQHEERAHPEPAAEGPAPVGETAGVAVPQGAAPVTTAVEASAPVSTHEAPSGRVEALAPSVAEPEDWEDIDAEFELATPFPGPALTFELATPTPSPVFELVTRRREGGTEAVVTRVDAADVGLARSAADDPLLPERRETEAPGGRAPADTLVVPGAGACVASEAQGPPHHDTLVPAASAGVASDGESPRHRDTLAPPATAAASDEPARRAVDGPTLEVAASAASEDDDVEETFASDRLATEMFAHDVLAVSASRPRPQDDVAVTGRAAEVPASRRAPSPTAPRAPFVVVTPQPAAVDLSPSPLGATSGTPTIVDATLYGLTGRVGPGLVDEQARVSVLSVELPPTDLFELAGDPAAGDDEVDVSFSEEPPGVVRDELAAAVTTVAEPLSAHPAERAREHAAHDSDAARPAVTSTGAHEERDPGEPARHDDRSVQDGALEESASPSTAASRVSALSVGDALGAVEEEGADDEAAPDDAAADEDPSDSVAAEGVARDHVAVAEVAAKSDLEQEAELAERLLTALEKRRSEVRPGSVEALLERFGNDPDEDAVVEAARSLGRMMRLEVTPAPALAAAPVVVAEPARRPLEVRPDPLPALPAGRSRAATVSVAGDDSDDSDDIVAIEDSTMDHKTSDPQRFDSSRDAVPSVSPPPVHVSETEDGQHDPMRLTPVTMTTERSPLAQRALFFSTTALLAGVFVVGFLYWQHPHVIGLVRDKAAAVSLGGAAPPAAGPCYAELTLKDLPSPHEVLLRLGEAPFTSQPLPTGVTLELIGLAPGHQPKRVIVPKDAAWTEGEGGTRALALHLALEGGETNSWPAAPPGEVGGIGPQGTLDITAQPAGAEVWLVAGAGEGDRAKVSVPCASTAHLLVLNPRDPGKRRRLSVEPNMLDAARHAGGAELSVTP